MYFCMHNFINICMRANKISISFKMWWKNHQWNVSFGNSMWSVDTTWWQRFGSTMPQVIACCLIIRKVQWHSYEGNYIWDTLTSIHEVSFKIIYVKFHQISVGFDGRGGNLLTHWGRVTHICIGKLTIMGSDNGLSPGRRQAIIWTNARILLIRPLGTNFSEILLKIYIFSFNKMHLKMSSGKLAAILSRPQCVKEHPPLENPEAMKSTWKVSCWNSWHGTDMHL